MLLKFIGEYLEHPEKPRKIISHRHLRFIGIFWTDLTNILKVNPTSHIFSSRKLRTIRKALHDMLRCYASLNLNLHTKIMSLGLRNIPPSSSMDKPQDLYPIFFSPVFFRKKGAFMKSIDHLKLDDELAKILKEKK